MFYFKEKLIFKLSENIGLKISLGPKKDEVNGDRGKIGSETGL
jgi:hypothetical protein